MLPRSRPLSTLRFRCRGHPNVRASHGKTLELTRDAEIGPRATCIVGVAAEFDPLAVARLRGPVSLELRSGDLVERVEAFVTPFSAPHRSLVLRKSEQRHGQTFAFGADRAAADLDREFVARLARPETVLDVTLRELQAQDLSEAGALYLVAPANAGDRPEDPRLAAVDVVAGREVPEGWSPEGVERLELGRGELSRASEALLRRLEEGERVALLLDGRDPLADPEMLELIGAAARRSAVSPVDVPPWLTALAVSGFPAAPLVLWADGDSKPLRRAGDLRRRLETFAALPATLVMADLRLSPPAALETVGAVLGDRELVLGRNFGSSSEEVLRGPATTLVERLATRLGGERPEVLALALAPPSEGTLGPCEPLLRALLAEGVAVRSLAKALASLPGGASRGEAYELLLALRDKGEAP